MKKFLLTGIPVITIFIVFCASPYVGHKAQAQTPGQANQYSDFSITATGGTANTSIPAAPQQASRHGIQIQDVSPSDNVWFNFTAAATAGAGSFELSPGQVWTSSPTGTSIEPINVLLPSSGDGITVKTW